MLHCHSVRASSRLATRSGSVTRVRDKIGKFSVKTIAMLGTARLKELSVWDKYSPIHVK